LGFESYLKKLPDGRHKVAVATALMEVIPEARAEAARQEAAPSASRWHSLLALISMPSLAPRYGLAAAAIVLVLAAGVVWLFTQSQQLKRENEQLRSQIAQSDTGRQTLRQQMQTLEQQLAEQKKSADQLLGELEKEKQRGAEQAQEIARLQAAPSPIVALFLTPASRDTSVPDTLVLKESAKYVTLTVQIRSDEQYTGRPAVFQTTEGAQVQPLAGRQVQSAKLGKAVVFRLDASKLAQTTYKLTLTLRAEDGLEISPDYYFTIVRR
jgi:cell division protein FtsL